MVRKLAKGEILAESAFYKVDEVLANGDFIVFDDNGVKMKLSAGFIKDDILSSADYFEREEEVTATELGEIFVNSARYPMTVVFMKKDTPKTKTALKKEVQEWTENLKKEFMEHGQTAIEKYATNPVLTFIPGEERPMRGRHYGSVDNNGRVHFIDMDEAKGDKPEFDGRARLVDTRTLRSVIVNKVKYVLKKK